jgi:DNA mismatch repair protein MutL
VPGPAPTPPPQAETYADETAQAESALIEQLRRRDVKPQVLGQSQLTYVLAEAPGLGLLMLDQHAAHEKILYLEFMRRRGQRAVQELMVPYTYEAAPAERAALEALCPALADEGFDTEHFGGGAFVVNTLPLVFDKLDVRAFIRDLLDETGQGDIQREIGRVRHRIGAMAACRAAVKAGDALNTAQMQALLDQVLETAGALRCPHGRPTLMLLTRDQLDRQFGRLG